MGSLLLGALFLGCTSADPDRGAVYPKPTQGAAVSEHPLATEAGQAVLERGGNAADAAVAMALVLAVVSPESAGLGGGGLALWAAHDSGQEPLVLDFLGSPVAGQGQSASIRGRAAGVGVPGLAIGLWTLHEEFGRLSFRDVASYAVQLARNGFPVGAGLADSLSNVRVRAHLAGPAASLFYPAGSALEEGTLLQQDALARTLELLVVEGPSGFYSGRVGRALVDAVQGAGGQISAKDLAGARVTRRRPLSGWFRGLELLTVPMPSHAGFTFLQVLSMLDGFPLDEEIATARRDASAMGRPFARERAALSARAVHWWIEALRMAGDDCALLLQSEPEGGAVERLLAPTRIAAHRVALGEFANETLGSEVHSGSDSSGALSRDRGAGSTHVSVLDRDGNGLSLTLTLRGGFGSGLLVREAGFLLGRTWDSGSSPQRDPSLSTLTPTIVRENGRVVRWVLGASGGPQPVAACLQVFLRSEVYGQSLVHAMQAPRLEQRAASTSTVMEQGWDALLIQTLETRRHALQTEAALDARVQAIHLPTAGGIPEAVGDAWDR